MHGCTNAAGARKRRSGLQSFAFPPSRQLLHALPYLPTSLSVAWRSDALSENLLRQALSAGTGWVCRRRARGSVSLVTWSRAILGAAPYGRAKKARAQFCSRQNCLVADKTNLTGSNLDRRRRPVGRGPGKVRVKVTRVRTTDRDVGR